MTSEVTTALVLTGFLPVYLARELWVLARHEWTISRVAKSLAWKFSAFVFFWSSMAVHWFVPSPFTATRASSIAFWLLLVAICAWNAAAWRRCSRPVAEWPAWLRWLQWPVLYVAGGALAAWVLFPQTQMVPWGVS